MKHLHTFSMVIAAAALLAACGGSTSTDGQNQDQQPPTAVTAVAATDCANGDLGERSSLFNKTTLDAVMAAFEQRVKVDVGGTLKEVKDTRISLSVAKLKTLRDQLSPFAIMVHYGLDGDKFVPVFEFMKLDINGAMAVPMGVYYLAVGGELKIPAGPMPDPSDLLSNYIANIRIDRDGSGTFLPIETDLAKFADPRGEWFQFPLKLDRLIAENPGSGQALVLDCISERACYSGIIGLLAAGQDEEYRHMIAWHISHDGVSALDNTSLDVYRPLGNDYHERAADLGHLCPPRCK